MERIAGQTLLRRLDDLPLPYAEVAAIGAKVATALDDLHRQHVVHLDVKPSNIVMRESTGDAALVDFGLAHHDQLPDLMGEEFRVPYGTAPYMAPEQILGDRRDARSDLFALGVLLYFFSTGVRPFGDPKGKRRLHRRLWRDPVPPRKRRADFPPWLQEIILRCLEVDPAQRLSDGGPAGVRPLAPRRDEADGPLRAAEAGPLERRDPAPLPSRLRAAGSAAGRPSPRFRRRRSSRSPSTSPRARSRSTRPCASPSGASSRPCRTRASRA